MYIIIGGLYIGDFLIKLPITKVYSSPTFHFIQYLQSLLLHMHVVCFTCILYLHNVSVKSVIMTLKDRLCNSTPETL